MSVLVSIVEGHGEVQAVPVLLQRLVQLCAPGAVVKINPPIRIKQGSFLNDSDYFARYVSMAAEKAKQSRGHVLILLDCEDDCPALLGPKLLERARKIRPDVSMGVFLAYREYETWFIAAAESLRGVLGLPIGLMAPEDPERLRDAKGWLAEHMSHSYDPIMHQLEFTRRLDLNLTADRSGSFCRLRDAVADIASQSNG